jgi:Fe2+ or Zn2+ uptake regulation protein
VTTWLPHIRGPEAGTLEHVQLSVHARTCSSIAKYRRQQLADEKYAEAANQERIVNALLASSGKRLTADDVLRRHGFDRASAGFVTAWRLVHDLVDQIEKDVEEEMSRRITSLAEDRSSTEAA